MMESCTAAKAPVESRSWRISRRPTSLLQRVYEWLRRRVNHRLVGYLAEQICPPPGPPEPTIRVLEAGSGTAFATSVFSAQRAGTECVCMDIDEEALREARNRDAGVLAVVGDLRRMPFADGTFLLVFNSSTVEHLEDPSLAVAEMRRVCARSGGRVFVGVPYRYGPLWFQPLIRATRLGVWLGPVFSRATLHRLLRGVGLRPIADRRYFGRFFLGTVAERGA